MLITDGRSITLPNTYKEKLFVKVPDTQPLTADCLSEILPGSEVRRNAVISSMRGVTPDARDALYLAVYHRWADDPLEVVVANVMAIRLAWTHLERLGQFELSALERGILAQIVTGDRTLHRLWRGELQAKTGRSGTLWWFTKRLSECAPSVFVGPVAATFAARYP